MQNIINNLISFSPRQAENAQKAADFIFEYLLQNRIKATVEYFPLKIIGYKGKIANITVGNKKSPATIIFAHYDSLGTGATDNASGVAVCLEAIIKFPEILQNNLFVFDGNEELSYDSPIYWGKGFRIFEKRYFSILEKAKKILILDCVGNGKTQKSNKLKFLKLAFPIKNLKKWQNKTTTFFGDIDKLMKVYHTNQDNINQLQQKYLKECLNLLLSEIV